MVAILERPVVSVDVVLFGFRQDTGTLELLLLRREAPPFRGAWGLPGVAVRADETLAAAARRALLSKVGLDEPAVADFHLEQLATFDALYRDPRGRTISVAHLGLANTPTAHVDESRTRWRPLGQVLTGQLPFDHEQIVETAITRLQGKLRYTNIAAQLLPDRFRIEQLQAVYEALLGRPLNRTNFRTKLLKIGLIERAGVAADDVGDQGGRPPHIYRFTSDEIEALERDFV